MTTRAFDDTTQAADDQDKEIDLREYLGLMLEGWPWILTAAILGLLVATYFAWSAAPMYRASSLMRVEAGQNLAPQAMMEQSISSALPGAGGGGSSVSAEGAIIASRSVIGGAVDKLHLRVRSKPDYFPVVGEPLARLHAAVAPNDRTFSGLGGYAWGSETANVTRIQLPDTVESAHFTMIARSNGHYELRSGDPALPILEGEVGKTASGKAPGIGAIKIFVESISAGPGTRFDVDFVPHPAAVANVQSRLDVEEQPPRSGLLNLELVAPSPEAAQGQLDAVMSSYIQQNVERQSKQAEQRLEFLKKQLPELKEQRDTAQGKLSKYQSDSGMLDLSAQAQALLQQLTNLGQQIAQADIERQQVLQEYTPEHPLAKAAADKKAALERRRSDLEAELKKLPTSESEMLKLQSSVQVNEQLYGQLLNTSQGLQISKAGITGVSNIIDMGYAPDGKVSPKRLLWAVTGILLGMFLGALLVITRALLRSTLDDPDVIESKYGLSVFATVPYSDWERKRGRRRKSAGSIMAVEQPDDPSIESLRSLRTSLQFALMGAESNAIAISGPTPACGKSFVSSNLAALVAQSGVRVLLVDADMRRGALHRTFGIEHGPGLSNVLTGETDLATAAQQSGVEGLDVLTVGDRPPNPAELLISPRFTNFKALAEERYDYLVFDLPPILNVTDASIIAKQSAATFLVVRSEHSTGSEVDQAIKRFRRDDIRISGAIFNGLRANRLRYAGRGKYGHYRYQY